LNASPYFGRIWSWLVRWIDPRTAEKLVIVSTADVYSTLSSHIDNECIPSQFGGSLQFDHGQTPNLDRHILGSVKWLEADKLPPGAIKLVKNEDGTRTIVAVGKVEGEERRIRLGTVADSQPAPAQQAPAQPDPASS
jgi:hypothetical protein